MGKNENQLMDAQEMQPMIPDAPPISTKKAIFFTVILYLLFLSDLVCRIGVNTLYPLIQSDLGLSDAQIGLLTSAIMLTMSLCVLPFSYIADKFSKKKSIVIMTMFWSVATMLTGFAKSFPAIFLGRAGVGIGNSAYAPTSVSIITGWFDKKRWGKVLGVYNTAMMLGAAVGAMICGFTAQSVGWRNTLFIIGGVSFLLSLLTLFLPNEKKKQKSENKKKKVTLKETCQVLLSNRTLMLMCLGAGFMALINNAITGFMSIFYVRELGMSIVQVGSIMGTSGLIGAAAYPIGGYVLDKWYAIDKRARMWLPAIAMLLTGGSYCIVFIFGFWPMVFAAPFFSGFIATALHTASQELVPEWNKSVSYGVYVMITKFFGVLGPIMVGVLSNQFGLTSTLAGVQLSAVLMAACLFIASTSYLKDFDKARALESGIQGQGN